MTEQVLTWSRPGAAIAALRANVDRRPWRTIAGAAALGAAAAALQPRLPRSRIARDALAVVGGIAVQVVRARVAGMLARAAWRWVGARPVDGRAADAIDTTDGSG